VSDEITTLEEFREACQRHDLTYEYSDDGRYWRAGCASYDRIRKAAKQFPREDVERIWNEIVDQKLVPDARERFYWPKERTETAT
jgi:hypothetical protein